VPGGGITRATTVEAAFEAAATFATQPLPIGTERGGLTTAGGWGVVTADAVTQSRARSDAIARRPARRDRRQVAAPLEPQQPGRLRRGETRDTIPSDGADRRAPEVHAIIYLGVGIQSNQARMMREGGFYPAHGLDRIVAYHERQDARFAEAAAELSDRTGKPILVASELAVADPANPGPAAVACVGSAVLPERRTSRRCPRSSAPYAAYREQRRS
jgi:acetyltransferase